MGKGVVGEVKSQLEMLVGVVPGTGWSSMYLHHHGSDYVTNVPFLKLSVNFY